MKTRIWILLVVLAAFAVPSFAQYDDAQYDRFREIEQPIDDGGGFGIASVETLDAATYLDNPCTAAYDWVYVDYSVYLEQESMQTAIGDRYLFDENTSVGGSYAAAGASRSDVMYKAEPFTLRQYHKVNTPDAFHVVTVIDYDPIYQQTYLSIETACGNGMPDSAQ
jgi:hypothetical protein